MKRLKYSSNKIYISFNLLINLVILISFFFPLRGSILGIRNYYFFFGSFLLLIILQKRLVIPKLPFFIFFYLLTILVTCVYHIGTQNILYTITEFAPYFIIFYMILNTVRTESLFYKVLDCLIIVFAVYSILCIFESIFHINIFDILTGTSVEYVFANEIRYGFARTRGALDISINNGMMLCFALTVATYRLMQMKSIKFLFTYILIFSAAFLTMSRGVWIDLLVNQGLIFLSFTATNKIKTIIRFFVFFVSSISMMFLLFPETVIEMANAIISLVFSVIEIFTVDNIGVSGTAVGARFALWGWVYEVVQNDLLFGKGFGEKFVYAISQNWIKESIEVAWLYILYKRGLVGLVGFISFLLGALIYFQKNHKDCKNKGITIDFNYYLISAVIAYSITLFTVAKADELKLFCILIALGVCYNRIIHNKNNDHLDLTVL